MKVISPIGDAYEWVIGFLRLTAGGFRGDLLPILVYRDPSDLWVLPILFASYLVVTHHRTRRRRGRPSAR